MWKLLKRTNKIYKTLLVRSLHEFIFQDIYRDKQIVHTLTWPRGKEQRYNLLCPREAVWLFPLATFVAEVEKKEKKIKWKSGGYQEEELGDDLGFYSCRKSANSLCTCVYACICMCMCVCWGFLLTYMTNTTLVFYISTKRFPTVLGCLLFVSRDIGQKADNPCCLARLRRAMLTCIPAKLLVHKALSE